MDSQKAGTGHLKQEVIEHVEDFGGTLLPVHTGAENLTSWITRHILRHEEYQKEFPELEKLVQDLEDTLSKVKIVKQWQITEPDMKAVKEFENLGFDFYADGVERKPKKDRKALSKKEVGRYFTRYPESVQELRDYIKIIHEVVPEAPLSLEISLDPECGSRDLWIKWGLKSTPETEKNVRYSIDMQDKIHDIAWNRKLNFENVHCSVKYLYEADYERKLNENSEEQLRYTIEDLGDWLK
jgi:hypothetical protein